MKDKPLTAQEDAELDWIVGELLQIVIGLIVIGTSFWYLILPFLK